MIALEGPALASLGRPCRPMTIPLRQAIFGLTRLSRPEGGVPSQGRCDANRAAAALGCASALRSRSADWPAVLVALLGSARVLATSLHASAPLALALLALLGRAISVSRKEAPVEVTHTHEMEMEHPGNSPETLY